MKKRLSVSVLLIALLAMTASYVCAAEPVPQSSIRWAERQLADASNPSRCIEDMRYGPFSTEDAFQWLLVKRTGL